MDAPLSTVVSEERKSPPRNQWRTAGLILAFTVGLGAFLFTSTLSACGLTLALIESRWRSPLMTMPALSLAAVGVGMGVPLAWQAIAGLSGWPSRRFALPLGLGIALVLVYLVALGGGQAVLSLQLAPALTLPPFHIVALALPPLLLLCGAAALTREPQFTWRQWWSGLSGGAFGSLTIAFFAEMILVVIGFALLVIVLMAMPDQMEQLRGFQPTPGGQLDPEQMRVLSRNPVLILTVLVSLSLIVPLVEEAAKSIGPALVGAWHRPSAALVFLWGVAGGAGFAVVEGMLNGGLSIEAWSMTALLRVGTAAMHCVTAGLTGWGWGQVWTRRKWLLLLLSYTLAVALHGVWNLVSIGMGLASVAFDSGILQNALIAAAVGLLLLLTLGMIVALFALAGGLALSKGKKVLAEEV